MRISYEENIVDIIHALHELRRLSAPEILAIKETAERLNPNTTPMYEIFYEYDRLYKHYMKTPLTVIIATDKKHKTNMLTFHGTIPLDFDLATIEITPIIKRKQKEE